MDMKSPRECGLPMALCRKLVLLHYPFTMSELCRFLRRHDWETVCENVNVQWDADILDRYPNRLNWSLLSGNAGFPWSDEIIERFASRWDWEALSANQSLPWSEDLVRRYEDRWGWVQLSSNRALSLTPEWLHTFAERWVWGGLSDNRDISWSWDQVRQFTPRPQDWSHVPMLQGIEITPDMLPGLPPECFQSLSLRGSAGFWLADILGRYADLWNWEWLSGNIALPWSPELIGRFSALLDLHLVARLLAQPWNPETMSLYGHTPDSLLASQETASVMAKGTLWDENRMCILECSISCEERLVWTEDFIIEQADNLCVPALMDNPAITWSKDFIYKMVDIPDWGNCFIAEIGSRRNVPWDDELVVYAVEQIVKRWPDEDYMLDPLVKNPDVWNAVKNWARLSPKVL